MFCNTALVLYFAKYSCQQIYFLKKYFLHGQSWTRKKIQKGHELDYCLNRNKKIRDYL